jgi:polar amino acid transport system substrate-binding protein
MVSLRAVVLLLFFGFVCGLASAQEAASAGKPLRIAVTGDSPFVTVTDGVFNGMSVSVWEAVASKNGWSYVYTAYPTAQAAFDAMANGKADLVVGNIYIQSALFNQMEFSQPYFRTGLQIMVPEARPKTFHRLIEDLEMWGHLKIFWSLIGCILAASIFVALFERKHNPDFPKGWADGFAEALYYVVSLSLGKSAYKGFGGWKGRLVMIVWTILGVVVIIFLTSSVTATLTAEAISSHIVGPESLPGKTVGVVTGSHAMDYLKEYSITYNEYANMDDAVRALIKGSIPGVVGSAPILQYYDNSHMAMPITEVGPIFWPYYYGFAMPIGSSLRGPLNRALLSLEENGSLLQIGKTYFGDVYRP